MNELALRIVFGFLFLTQLSPGSFAQSGIITTVAGNRDAGFSGDSGQATAAQLHGPSGVTVDSAGNLYIADSSNSRVRKVKCTVHEWRSLGAWTQ